MSVDSTGVTAPLVDSLPSDILANLDETYGAPGDILYIMFADGTTLQEKAVAIASINARVVGASQFRCCSVVLRIEQIERVG